MNTVLHSGILEAQKLPEATSRIMTKRECIRTQGAVEKNNTIVVTCLLTMTYS